MVKDHSDSERGNKLPPHGLLFSISSKGSFICIIPHHRHDNIYRCLCYTSRGELAGTINGPLGTLRGIDPTTHCTISGRFTERYKVLFNTELFYLWLRVLRVTKAVVCAILSVGWWI